MPPRRVRSETSMHPSAKLLLLFVRCAVLGALALATWPEEARAQCTT
ncbi:MAG: hypothetical protein R3B48_12810 [Kofleriaceae bacterium]